MKETTREMIIRKLTSRKLWVAVALFVSGCFAAAGHTEDGKTVYGLIMQAAAVIGYIVGEGLTDAARVKAEAGKTEEIPTGTEYDFEEVSHG